MSIVQYWFLNQQTFDCRNSQMFVDSTSFWRYSSFCTLALTLKPNYLFRINLRPEVYLKKKNLERNHNHKKCVLIWEYKCDIKKLET